MQIYNIPSAWSSCPPLDDKDDYDWAPLYLCEAGFVTPQPENTSDYLHSKLLSFTQGKLCIVYCINKADYDPPSWAWVASPFDTPTWFGLLITIALFALVGRRISMMLNAVNFFIYIGPSNFKNWKNPALFFSLALISFLSYHYEAFMTTNITAPLGLHVLLDIKEWLDNGFRLIVPSMHILNVLRFAMGEEIRQQLGRNISARDLIVDAEMGQGPEQFNLTWRHKMASIKGVFYIYEVLAYKLKTEKIVSRDGNVVCFVINNCLGPFTVLMNSYSSMTGSWFLQNVLLWNGPAGIDRMFQDRYFTKIARKLATNNVKTQALTNGDEITAELRLRLYSNFGVLFLYVGFLLGVSLAVFGIEFRCNVVLSKFSRIFQERYRLILLGLKSAVNLVSGKISKIKKRIFDLFIIIFLNVLALFRIINMCGRK